MAVAALRGLFRSNAAEVVTPARAPLYAPSRLLRQALEALERRDLDREARRLLHQSGGRLTDSVEREIARCYLGI